MNKCHVCSYPSNDPQFCDLCGSELENKESPHDHYPLENDYWGEVVRSPDAMDIIGAVPSPIKQPIKDFEIKKPPKIADFGDTNFRDNDGDINLDDPKFTNDPMYQGVTTTNPKMELEKLREQHPHLPDDALWNILKHRNRDFDTETENQTLYMFDPNVHSLMSRTAMAVNWQPQVGTPWQHQGMAERSGDPQLDALIEEFEKEIENQELWVACEADGMCEQISQEFQEWLQARGVESEIQYIEATLDDDYPNFEQMGYGDRIPNGNDWHAVVRVKMPSGEYTVDFTASQYGYTEFPMVQKLQDGGWQREWTSSSEDVPQGIEPTSDPCYLNAAYYQSLYPHLEYHAGFYSDPVQGDQHHAWLKSPSGTIIDPSHEQFDPNEPMGVFPAGHPMQDRYRSWVDHPDMPYEDLEGEGWPEGFAKDKGDPMHWLFRGHPTYPNRGPKEFDGVPAPPWKTAQREWTSKTADAPVDPFRFDYVPLTTYELGMFDMLTPQEKQAWYHRARHLRRRALETGQEEVVNARELYALANRYDNQCAYCGKDLNWSPGAQAQNDISAGTFDHNQQLSAGGTGGADNIVPSCWGCNKDLELYERSQRDMPERAIQQNPLMDQPPIYGPSLQAKIAEVQDSGTRMVSGDALAEYQIYPNADVLFDTVYYGEVPYFVKGPLLYPDNGGPVLYVSWLGSGVQGDYGHDWNNPPSPQDAFALMVNLKQKGLPIYADVMNDKLLSLIERRLSSLTCPSCKNKFMPWKDGSCAICGERFKYTDADYFPEMGNGLQSEQYQMNYHQSSNEPYYIAKHPKSRNNEVWVKGLYNKDTDEHIWWVPEASSGFPHHVEVAMKLGWINPEDQYDPKWLLSYDKYPHIDFENSWYPESMFNVWLSKVSNWEKTSMVIEQDRLPNGYLVSTIEREDWLKTMDDTIGVIGDIIQYDPVEQGRPNLLSPGDFETMVFAYDLETGEVNYAELDFRRYHSKEEALTGHQELVEKWSKGGVPDTYDIPDFPDFTSNNVSDNDSPSRFIHIDREDLSESTNDFDYFQIFCPQCNKHLQENGGCNHCGWSNKKLGDIGQSDIADDTTYRTELYQWTDPTLHDLRERENTIEQWADSDGNVHFVYTHGKVYLGKSTEQIISQDLLHDYDVYKNSLITGTYNINTKIVQYDDNVDPELKGSFMTALKREIEKGKNVDSPYYPRDDKMQSWDEIHDVWMH